ncbi:MAG: fibronectin type III domain-containing protein [Acidobacteria bacterium]|nr:MAG: fibronectin type III domain-containing protein [Acidobacteriota bacterium]
MHLGAICLAASAALPAAGAFEDEHPVFPADDAVVGREIHFFIGADGRPDPAETYRIEVALDDDFEQIVAVFDSGEKRTGWSVATRYDVGDVPEQYRPQFEVGIHYFARGRLSDGVYYWRVSKSLAGGAYEVLDRPVRFVVDTVPPEPVTDLTLLRDRDGTLVLRWSPVDSDGKGDPERVAGFRVYQYTKVLRMYRPLTRYIIAESTEPEVRVPLAAIDDSRIVFFRVQAVDEVGNEEGRSRPKRIGEIETTRTINADQLTDPAYLKRLAEEQR